MNFVDIQVNGYAGISFHADPLTQAQIHLVAQRLRAGGVDVILPTIVTDALDLMSVRLRTMRQLIDQDASLRQLMPAFHIEGPCLSPEEGYRGAHPPEHMRPASRDVIEPLIEAAGGPARVAMVTLAPEVDHDLQTTRWLKDMGVIVCAGHTDASLDVLREAEQAGITLFTHLGNGSAAMMPRHDNIIFRAMSLETIKFSLIPDGHHVPFFVLRNWIRWLGVARCVFTTDCVSAADAPAGFDPGGIREIVVTEGTQVVRFKGTPYLAGSALTMRQACDNAVKHLGLSEAQARDMCVNQPRALIRKWLST